jgi:hypothetical protein
MPCVYCGRENGDEEASCRECGTDLQPPPQDPSGLPRYRSPVRVAFASGIGAALVCTAAICLAGRLFFDIAEMANGGPIGRPGIYGVGMTFVPFLLPLALGSSVFTFGACIARCPFRWLGVLTAIIALVGAVAVLTSRELRLALPAVLLGKATRSSLGWYLGATIQLGLGAWLLGWLARIENRRRQGQFTQPV